MVYRFCLIAVLGVMTAGCGSITPPKSNEQSLRILETRFEHYFMGNVYQIKSAMQFGNALHAVNDHPNRTAALYDSYKCLKQSMGAKDIKRVVHFTKQHIGGSKDIYRSLKDIELIDPDVKGYCVQVDQRSLKASKYMQQITGIDVNVDGIRDDIERRIDKDFPADSLENKYLRMYAGLLQQKLIYDYRSHMDRNALHVKIEQLAHCADQEINKSVARKFDDKYRDRKQVRTEASFEHYMDMLARWTYNTHQRKFKVALSDRLQGDKPHGATIQCNLSIS